MAEKIISPGVFTDEIDQSFLPAAIAEVGAVIVGPTVKGPAGIPTKVESYADFVAQFGDSFESGSVDGSDVQSYQYLTSHAAREYLQNNNTLTVVRILAGSYGGASATISSSIDPNVVGGGTQATASLRFGLVDHVDSLGSYLSGSVISGFASSSVFIGGSSGSSGAVEFVFTSSGTHTTLSSSATRLMVPLEDMKSGPAPGGAITNLNAAGLTASMALTAIINNSSSLHGLDITASAGPGTGSNVVTMSYGVAGAFGEYGRIWGGSMSGSDYGPDSLTIVTSSVSMSVANPFAQFGGSGSSAFQGGHDYNGGVFQEVFKLHTLSDGEDQNSGNGYSHEERTVYRDNQFLVSGSRNNLRWEITSLNKQKGTFSLVIRGGDDTLKNKKTLETWTDLDLDPNSTNYIGKRIGDQYFTLAGTGGTGDVYLSPNGENPVKSKYVRVEVLKKTPDYINAVGEIREPAYTASLPAFYSGSNSGSYGGSFSGGSDGTVQHPIGAYTYENISEDNSQGLDASNDGTNKGYNDYVDALDLLSNQDEYDFNLLMMPGITANLHSKLVSKAIDVCEDRGDCFVLADLVDHGKTATDAQSQAEGLDSSYAAGYWPWVQMGDPVTGKPRWVPPSVALAGVYSFNDSIGYPWTAPAGLNRGVIQTAVQLEKVVTQSDRDDLYTKSVNPLTSFPGEGVCVWGQKTFQKKPSALDRVNVRRLLIRVKKFIASSSRFLVFEQNTAATRRRFLNIATPFLEEVQANSGVNAFRVVMDETNNTPDTIDRNILYGQIFIQPTRTAEFIVLDFTVQSTGATFPE